MTKEIKNFNQAEKEYKRLIKLKSDINLKIKAIKEIMESFENEK